MIVAARTFLGDLENPVSVGLRKLRVAQGLWTDPECQDPCSSPTPTHHSSREFKATVPSKPTINTEFADRLEQCCGPCNNLASSVLWRSDASTSERVKSLTSFYFWSSRVRAASRGGAAPRGGQF
jgi:hypothetical protein